MCFLRLLRLATKSDDLFPSIPFTVVLVARHEPGDLGIHGLDVR